MSYVFLAGFFVNQITTGKKVQLSDRRLECLGVPWAWINLAGSLIKLRPEKNVQSSGHRFQCWIVLAGLLLYFLAGSLIKLQIATRKIRYSCLAIGWNVTSKTCLTMVEPFAGPSSMAMGNQPMPLRYPLCKRLSKGRVQGFLLTLWSGGVFFFLVNASILY